MSLWRIAWRSVEQRGLASLLTTLSMALGVMMVVAVLSIHGVVAESFRNNASLGYNMIVGAKGGKLQLTLNTVYYLSQPVENIPYDFYLEFLPASERWRRIQRSLAFRDWQRRRFAVEASAGLPSSSVAERFCRGMIARTLPAASAEQAGWLRDGQYAPFTAMAIPVCLGDYFGRFRVVGTTPDFFDHLTFGQANDRHYEFAEGRNFRGRDDEHGYFEAVVGSKVAKEMDVHLGDRIATTHGDPEGHGHGTRFTVVGILAPSGTPNDRAVFVNIEGFYLMADHAKPLAEEDDVPVHGEAPIHGRGEAVDEGHDHDGAGHHDGEGDLHDGQDHEDDHAHEDDHDRESGNVHEEAARTTGAHDHEMSDEPLPLEQREVTALLVRTVNPIVAMGLQNSINEGRVAQAVMPVRQIFNLFELIVRPIELVLLALTVLICVVSGVSILVSIYNSMSDRRHDIAVMRALGAGRATVMTIILCESILLSLGGGMMGWVAGHALNWLASPRIEAQTGVALHFWDVAPPIRNMDVWGLGPVLGWVSPEILLIPGLILLAILVGLLPAVAAYRTDVARSLQP